MLLLLVIYFAYFQDTTKNTTKNHCLPFADLFLPVPKIRKTGSTWSTPLHHPATIPPAKGSIRNAPLQGSDFKLHP